jgi:hypothetical protein
MRENAAQGGLLRQSIEAEALVVSASATPKRAIVD